MPVGYHNLTIVVAGQSGFLHELSPAALLVGCPIEAFGHWGESCAHWLVAPPAVATMGVCHAPSCCKFSVAALLPLCSPTGATCAGFIQDESIGVEGDSSGIALGPYSHYNVTLGPVMVGDVQVGRRCVGAYVCTQRINREVARPPPPVLGRCFRFCRGVHTYPVPLPGASC